MAKEKTFYLKGIAITAVLIAHYANYYAAGFYQKIQWYANGILAIFFVLSGYGLYFTFERRFLSGAHFRRSMLQFYFARAVRIYPYYWLALFLTPFFLPEYKLLHSASLSSIAIYLGIPFIEAPGLFWFVTAIIQCYLLSPFLYLLLKKLRPWKYLTAILYSVTLSMIISVLLTYWPLRIVQEDLSNQWEAFTYRGLLLTNVFLFGLGMAIPLLVEFVKNKPISHIAFYASVILFGVSVSFTRFTNSLFPNSHLFMAFFFILSAFSLCLFTVAIKPVMPFKKLFARLGKVSYPVYLFHMIFFGTLAGLGLLSDGSKISVIYTLLAFPFFVGICMAIEKGHRFVFHKIKSISYCRTQESAAPSLMRRFFPRPDSSK